MLVYEKKVSNTRKLFGTKGVAPSNDDKEILVNGESFDFVGGKYFYKAPGGIQDSQGNDVTVTLDDEILLPRGAEEIVDEDYDTVEELVDDNNTTDDDTDDTLKKVWTEEELLAETKATIAKMAELLGYTGIDTSMSKADMVAAFLEAQEADNRNQ